MNLSFFVLRGIFFFSFFSCKIVVISSLLSTEVANDVRGAIEPWACAGTYIYVFILFRIIHRLIAACAA
ncbi:hypothetical protein DFH27DRAFT_553046 [Peziza echinospora]|nr:hypothetical protein DFH27DRAFT_553046 [Peziza echinospora]